MVCVCVFLRNLHINTSCCAILSTALHRGSWSSSPLFSLPPFVCIILCTQENVWISRNRSEKISTAVAMASPVDPRLSLLLLLALCSCSVLSLPFNMSVDGSGDELELIFQTTRAPAPTASPSPSPSSTALPDLTLTFIRIKNFLFNDVVDFLRDNMLLIIIIMSLIIVIVFIACCASAMSHKRKLEAYYPPRKQTPRKYMSTSAADQAQAQNKPHNPTTSYLRTPTKDLVGEKEGRDPRPKPREVHKAEDVEEVEVQKEEVKKKKDESKPSTSTGGNGQAPVCTCHLKKANH